MQVLGPYEPTKYLPGSASSPNWTKYLQWLNPSTCVTCNPKYLMNSSVYIYIYIYISIIVHHLKLNIKKFFCSICFSVIVLCNNRIIVSIESFIKSFNAPLFKILTWWRTWSSDLTGNMAHGSRIKMLSIKLCTQRCF